MCGRTLISGRSYAARPRPIACLRGALQIFRIWLIALQFLTLTAHASPPQLQVESSRIAGGEKLAISADGRLIAQEREGIVTLKDGTTGRTLRHWRVSTESYTEDLRLCFPGDHRLLAVLDNAKFTLWDTATGTQHAWNVETEWSQFNKKECIVGVGLFAQNNFGPRHGTVMFSSLSLPANLTRAPQLVVPAITGRKQRLIAVPGGQFVGIGQFKSILQERSQQPLVTLHLLDAANGKPIWQVADIPTDIEFGEVRSLAISPNGRRLAYIQQARGRGDTLSTYHVKGTVVVLDPKSGKRLNISGLRDLQAERLAFVNNGDWLMIAADDAAEASFFDLHSGKKIRSFNGIVQGIYDSKSRSVILDQADKSWTSIIDLPAFSERARTGRLTSTLQTMAALQGRLLVADGSSLKEIPVLSPSQGIEFKTSSKYFLQDAQTDRIAYGLGVDDLGDADAAQGVLRQSNGQQTALRLPNNDRAWDGAIAAFVPGGELIVGSNSVAEIKKYQALNEQDVEQFFRSNESGKFAATLRTRFYRVKNDGAIALAGTQQGAPTLMRVSPNGKQLWLAMDQELVALSLPAFNEQSRISIGDSIFDVQFMGQEQVLFVQSAEGLTLWNNGTLVAKYPRDGISVALVGPQEQVFIAEGQKLKRWFPERQLPAILPVPNGAIVADNLSRYARNTAQGAEVIDVASGQKRILGDRCKNLTRISPDGRYLICKRSVEKEFPMRFAVVDAETGSALRSIEHVADDKLGFSADSRQIFFQQKQRIPHDQYSQKTLYAFTALTIASGETQEIFNRKDLFHIAAVATSADAAVLAIAYAVTEYSADTTPKFQRKNFLNVFQKPQEQYVLTSSIPMQDAADTTIEALDISPQGDRIAIGESNTVSVYTTSAGSLMWRNYTHDTHGLRFDATGKVLAGIKISGQDISVHEAASGRLLQDFHIPFKARELEQQLASPGLEPIGAQLTLTRFGIIEPRDSTSVRHALSADPHARAYETLFTDDASISGLAQLTPDLLALLRNDGLITLFKPQQQTVLARIALMPSGNWVVVAPDGRFDTGALEDLAALHWVLPDEPYRPLPLELFMRQYYEPGLLQKIIHGGALTPLPELAALNRAQPKVTIDKVTPAADPKRVDVTLKFEQGVYAGLRNGKSITERSGLRHVRLFRDGQLVGTLLDAAPDASATPKSWTFKNIQLPGGAAGRDIAFIAYAFNRDEVKGPTHVYPYHATRALKSNARAVIVSIGVNQYENPRFDLIYAAHDARSFGKTLETRLKHSGRYATVINHTLVSDQATPQAARKLSIRALFERLGGKGIGKDNINTLPTLTPNDTLILFFAGHGVLDESGAFYLLPHDIGAKLDDDTLQRAISSTELATWLRAVDAQEIVLVVDACHSAGAVGGKEFKPGPMGSRGLGQLAYDKGMRILAATQADDVALEAGNLQHGMLTYTLLNMGLQQGQADYRPKDGAVLLGEWLHYATDGVPRLAQQVLHAQQNGRGAKLKARGSEQSLNGLQQPALFDFRRSRIQELRLQ